MIGSNTLDKHQRLIQASCFSLLMMGFYISLTTGVITIKWSEFLLWLSGQSDLNTHLILSHIRLPRAILALCIGAILSSCGVVTQSLFRNPLADPAIIGVSAGASVGASLSIVLVGHFEGWQGLSLTSLSAFIGAILTVALVYRISTNKQGTSVVTMLLAGIALSFMAGSLSTFLEFIASNETLRRLSLWRMGGLEAANLTSIPIGVMVATGILGLIWTQRTALNALLLGESEARHLGIPVDRVKKILILTIAAGIGTCVALAGTIAFVGLVVPHCIRFLVGPNHRFLIPYAALAGSLLLLIADVLARVMLAPTELPVGLITAFIGAPVFLMLLVQQSKKGVL